MRVIGVDSSTQSVKVLLVDAADGTVLATGRAPHPDGVECDPADWEQALHRAAAALPAGADALGIAAQQHGMIALDDAGEPVRPASLWHDTRAAGDAADLVAELGAEAWADAVGSVPVASFTVAKLRWLARTDPAAAARVATVMLPHDWLTWRLTGEAPVTDRGDASGTGYYSAVTGEYRPDLLERALGRPAELPRVAAPSELIGTGRCPTPDGGTVSLSAGTGDNMAAALGLGAQPGDLILSLGTSGTAFAVSPEPSRDPRGLVAGFADATGHYLPLACTLNAARVLDTVAALLAVSHAELSALALSAPPGAGGLVLLPYLDGERTPSLPAATGTLGGVTRDLSRATLARAAIEGIVCALADAADALAIQPRRILLIGGAAASPAVQQITSSVLGRPVTVPAAAEYVALGAARQAAWALSGTASPPDWPVPATTVAADPAPQIREQFRDLRESRHPDALEALP